MFGRALGRYDLDDRALAVVESDYALAKPKDPIAWLAARGEAFGWKQFGAAPPTPAAPVGGAPSVPAPVTPAVPSGPPVTSRATPPNSAAPTEDTPILRMSQPDQAALLDDLVRKHGFIEGNSKFAERLDRELKTRNTRVRPRIA